ncbi:MAG TPA: hypothetical protein VLC49_11995 [Solirubrobacteraceae bacterium]|nr:hypothetical protein [Solirubrobacteraceae bacterium]
MAEAVEPATAGASGVAFELDRIEMAGEDRIEVNGRWFGVRGRRFIRPSLTLLADEEQRRLLADLDHKPWAAEDGQPWLATFPFDEQEGDWLEAELNVAPDITVTVPLPGASRGRARRPGSAAAGTTRTSSRRSHAPSAELVKARREIHRLQRELERRDGEIAELSAELEKRGAKLEEITGARDAAREAGTAAAEERERLMRARGEALTAREKAAGERDDALRERDEAMRLRDAALAARDEALAERRTAIDEREEIAVRLAAALSAQEAALAERDDAAAERDALLDERDSAMRDREGVMSASQRVTAERDALQSTIEQLRQERDEAVASRGAALVMRNAANAPPAYRRDGNRLLHFLPALVVVIVAFVAALLLHLI